MLQKQFVVWNYHGFLIAPLTDYINNPIYYKQPGDTYFSLSSEKIYLELRDRMGYTNAIEKLSRNDSKLFLKIELKIHQLKNET